MKAFLIVLFPLLLASFSLGQETPVAPKTINYQGKLTDASGGPLGGAAGGTFRLRFELFGVASGGTRVWAEEQEAVVIGGIFNVALGGVGGTQVETTTRDLGAAAFAGPDRFLQITILSGPGLTGEQTLAPRQQLASVPYALVAQSSQEAHRAAVAALAESLIPHLEQALNPPGTIIAYAKAVVDNGGLMEPVPGYLLCNGAVIDATVADGKYAALMMTLRETWGNGADADTFTVNLPDLRGVFLRGWSGEAADGYVDPDRNNRVARLGGGHTGNKVGSFQMDEFKRHSHGYTQPWPSTLIGNINGTNAGARNSTTAEAGGNETRPKNANVVYLIKY